MNARLLCGLAAFAALGAAARADTPSPAAPQAPVFLDAARLGLIPDNYKKPAELPESYFNPFKVQAVTDESSKQAAPTVSNDTITSALAERGLTGLLYGASPADNRVILGDEVFGVGDELAFTGDKEGPLVSGANVVLRAVNQEDLALDVTPTGEPSRTLHVSLRGFWRP